MELSTYSNSPNCVFDNNVASGGGAIRLSASKYLDSDNCTFKGNKA